MLNINIYAKDGKKYRTLGDWNKWKRLSRNVGRQAFSFGSGTQLKANDVLMITADIPK